MTVIDLPVQKSERQGRRSRSEKPALSVSDAYVPKLRNRTPEQIDKDAAALMSGTHKPHPLPPGKTVWDMIVGQWPGDETDEEIAAALAELS